jgi:hypothetical protein
MTTVQLKLVGSHDTLYNMNLSQLTADKLIEVGNYVTLHTVDCVLFGCWEPFAKALLASASVDDDNCAFP